LVVKGDSFTGTAGVPPATRRRREVFDRRFAKMFSRFALIAGGTPAVPVNAMNGLFTAARIITQI